MNGDLGHQQLELIDPKFLVPFRQEKEGKPAPEEEEGEERVDGPQAEDPQVEDQQDQDSSDEEEEEVEQTILIPTPPRITTPVGAPPAFDPSALRQWTSQVQGLLSQKPIVPTNGPFAAAPFANAASFGKKRKEESMTQEKARPRGRSRSRSQSRAAGKAKLVDIPELVVKDVEDSSILHFGGKRRAGKTNAIIHLLTAKNIPRIVVLGNGDDWDSWKGVQNAIYFTETCSNETLEYLFSVQTYFKKRKNTPGSGHENDDIRLAVVMEDFSYDDSLMRCKALRNLFQNGRRKEILFFFTAQSLKSVPPKARMNMDRSFVFREGFEDERKNLAALCARPFGSKPAFLEYLDRTTQAERRTLVVHHTAPKTEQISDCASWFKARPWFRKPLGNFMSQVFHELYFVPEHQRNNPDMGFGCAAGANQSNRSILSEIQNVKVILNVDDDELIPMEQIKEASRREGVFEITASEHNVISFSNAS